MLLTLVIINGIVKALVLIVLNVIVLTIIQLTEQKVVIQPGLILNILVQNCFLNLIGIAKAVNVLVMLQKVVGMIIPSMVQQIVMKHIRNSE